MAHASDSLRPLLWLSEHTALHPESFATGSKDIQQTALLAAKCVFDIALTTETQSQNYVGQLISSLAPEQAPQTRSQVRANGKRKRSPSPSPSKSRPPQITPLASLFVDGMDDDQIWAQLELRAKHVCETLEEALEGTGEAEGSDIDGSSDSADMDVLEEDGEHRLNYEGSDDDDLDDDDDEELEDEEEDGEDEDEDEELEDEEGMIEEITHLRDSSDEGDEEELALDAPPNKSKASEVKSPKYKADSELDDGFFDLALFNAEIEQAEARSSSRGTLGLNEDDEDDEDDSVDLFASVDDSQALGAEEDPGEMGGEAYYKDFFALPAKAKAKAKQIPAKSSKVRFHEDVRVKKIKAKGKGLPVTFVNGIPEDLSLADLDQYGEEIPDEYEEVDEDDGIDESDIEGDHDSFGAAASGYSNEELGDVETMERFKDDLFAQEDDQPQLDLSTHEKRMAALRKQISALEVENVTKKDWTLMGEATARSRPQNSLLEEDLEFDRVMKVVPVVTEETVQNLEDRIKLRVLEGKFDDVVRTRPLDDKPFLPSRYFELQDTKSKQSLADIYEDEYTAAQTGSEIRDDRDGKLRAEHEDIEKQWETISAKLDALCNVHFTPKQPKAIILAVSNVAATTLESALPTSKSTNAMFAPEEVLAPSTSAPRASSELTPAEKRALHNKQRKKKRKARDVLAKTLDKVGRTRGIKSVKKQKEEALNNIVKSSKGVTVVGKKVDQNTKRSRSNG